MPCTVPSSPGRAVQRVEAQHRAWRRAAFSATSRSMSIRVTRVAERFQRLRDRPRPEVSDTSRSDDQPPISTATSERRSHIFIVPLTPSPSHALDLPFQFDTRLRLHPFAHLLRPAPRIVALRSSEGRGRKLQCFSKPAHRRGAARGNRRIDQPPRPCAHPDS